MSYSLHAQGASPAAILAATGVGKAEKSRTGIDTKPKLRVRDAMERGVAMMTVSVVQTCIGAVPQAKGGVILSAGATPRQASLRDFRHRRSA